MIPCKAYPTGARAVLPDGERSIAVWFDFIRHQLFLETSDGVVRTMQLAPRTVADFYRDFMSMLQSAGIGVKIWRMPVEIPDPFPFELKTPWAAMPPRVGFAFGFI